MDSSMNSALSSAVSDENLLRKLEAEVAFEQQLLEQHGTEFKLCQAKVQLLQAQAIASSKRLMSLSRENKSLDREIDELKKRCKARQNSSQSSSKALTQVSEAYAAEKNHYDSAEKIFADSHFDDSEENKTYVNFVRDSGLSAQKTKANMLRCLQLSYETPDGESQNENNQDVITKIIELEKELMTNSSMTTTEEFAVWQQVFNVNRDLEELSKRGDNISALG